MINGELKIQFDEGTNIMDIPGKAIPFVKLNITHYTADGQKKM